MCHKRKEMGGLGTIDLSIKTKIAACKIIADRQVEWAGNITNWKQKKGHARALLRYYKIMYGYFVKYEQFKYRLDK